MALSQVNTKTFKHQWFPLYRATIRMVENIYEGFITGIIHQFGPRLSVVLTL